MDVTTITATVVGIITFDQKAGQQEYRNEINDILRDYKEGYQLSEQGEIVITTPEGMERLLAATLPTDDQANIASRVNVAKQQFLLSRSSLNSRREAVRNLGDVLEYLKPELKNILTTKDTSDLFNILNNFGIRHHNVDQQTDYDQVIFLSWLFYYYLAAIHAAIHLINKQKQRSNP